MDNLQKIVFLNKHTKIKMYVTWAKHGKDKHMQNLIHRSLVG